MENTYLFDMQIADMNNKFLMNYSRKIKAYSEKQGLARALGSAKRYLGLAFNAKLIVVDYTVSIVGNPEDIAEIERMKNEWLVLGDLY